MIKHWGGTESLTARVRVVEPAGFTKVSALGVEEQRVNVIADFVGPAAGYSRVGDGFRVEARIVTWEANDVLLVPIGALFRDGETWAVFVSAGGCARLRAVQLGQRGEDVILHPGDRIGEGTRVRRR
jgi:HlyD family secretion protein